MDPMVVIGAALVAGGALPFALSRDIVAVALALAALIFVRGVRQWRLVLVALLALAIGAARSAQAVRLHDRALAQAAVVIPRPVRCTGAAHVASSPEKVHGALRWRGAFRDGDCEGAAWSGPVTLFGGPPALARGDDVEVVAQLAQPTRLWNENDPRPGEARQLSVRSGEAIVDARIVRRGTGALAAIDRARAFVRGRIDDTFPEDVAPMARALVLGESDLSPDDDLAMRTSGLAHLLAVSGMHLVIAVAGVVAALRALLLRARFAEARDVGRIAASLGVPLAWGYAEFAGSGGSTRRAAWMLTVDVRRPRAGETRERRARVRVVSRGHGDRRRPRRFRCLLCPLRGSDGGAPSFRATHRGCRRDDFLAVLQPLVRSASATLGRDDPLRSDSRALRAHAAARWGRGEPACRAGRRNAGTSALPLACAPRLHGRPPNGDARSWQRVPFGSCGPSRAGSPSRMASRPACRHRRRGSSRRSLWGSSARSSRHAGGGPPSSRWRRASSSSPRSGRGARGAAREFFARRSSTSARGTRRSSICPIGAPR